VAVAAVVAAVDEEAVVVARVDRSRS